MRGYRRKSPDHEEESFFISMTDIMVGLLFIFLIIIVYFSYQLKKENQALESYADTAQNHGIKILQALKKELNNKNIEVEVDTKQGILRLPDGVLFDSGKFRIIDPSDAYEASLDISEAFYNVLKCSVFIKKGNVFYVEKENCKLKNPSGVFVDSIFIEGHTDNVPISIGNLNLSSRRAVSTYEIMTQHRELRSYYSPDSREIFGISGFGDTRPIRLNDNENNRRANRRIDIRVIMYIPRSKSALKTFKERLCDDVKFTKYCR